MSALELSVLIGIIAAFTTFAVVLAWVSRADGKPRLVSSAMPAGAAARSRIEDRVDQMGRTSSA
jgi:hypothetical protein